MRGREDSLINEIQRDALRSDVPIADTLRKLIALGAQAGSTELRDWASRELRGYSGSGLLLPDYRKPSAVIKVDAVNFRYQITGQQISPRSLPEGVREHVDEEVPLGQPIGEIEAMLDSAKSAGGAIKLTLPRAQDVARLMDHEIAEPNQHITHIYWSLGEPALRGVIDRVRTTLVELVAEIQAGMPASDSIPTAEAADQAVNFAVYGRGARVTVNSAKGADGSTIIQHTAEKPTAPRSRWTRIGAALAGVATVATALITLAIWQGWGI